MLVPAVFLRESGFGRAKRSHRVRKVLRSRSRNSSSGEGKGLGLVLLRNPVAGRVSSGRFRTQYEKGVSAEVCPCGHP